MIKVLELQWTNLEFVYRAFFFVNYKGSTLSL